MQQELVTALILTAGALCAGVALVLCYLHSQAQKLWQGDGPVYLKKVPVEALLRDRPRTARS
jgi:hypothetical protein